VLLIVPHVHAIVITNTLCNFVLLIQTCFLACCSGKDFFNKKMGFKQVTNDTKMTTKMTSPSDMQVFCAAYEQPFFEVFQVHFMLLVD
jgi:hypothetical protein